MPEAAPPNRRTWRSRGRRDRRRSPVFTVARYDAARHRPGTRRVLEENGWEPRYVVDQLAAIDDLATGRWPGVRGAVFVVLPEGSEGPAPERLSGFVSVEFRGWNRLVQLHGLAVAPDSKRRSSASALVRRAEEFVREQPRGAGSTSTPRNQRDRAKPLPGAGIQTGLNHARLLQRRTRRRDLPQDAPDVARA